MIRKAALMLLGAAALASFGVSRPAGAVQTTTWGIMPAPDGSQGRPLLDHPATGKTVRDAVIVYNRTADPLVINLSVLGVSSQNGSYQFTKGGPGLAAGITLGASSIPLGPNQQARVPVTIRLPAHAASSSLAAIAAESAPVKNGALLVQQRLVVLVRATPGPTGAPAGPSSGGRPGLALWGSLAALVVAGVGGMAGRELRRNSARRPRPVGAG